MNLKNTDKESQLKLSREQQDEVKELLKKYCAQEFDIELGNLQSDMFIDFLSENVGKYYYNLGITSAIATMKEKTEDLVLLIKE